MWCFITITYPEEIFIRIDCHCFFPLGKSKLLTNRVKTVVLGYFPSIYSRYKDIFLALAPSYLYVLIHRYS